MADSEQRYADVVATFSPALLRLGRGYEHDPDRRRDLHQEILVALWRALPSFEGRSSLRTWVFRVAHNVAVTHASRARKARERAAVHLEDLESLPDPLDVEAALGRQQRVERILALVRALVPIDRQIILLHLEGVEPAEIAEVTGLSLTNVGTKVHRIKTVLRRDLGGEEREP